MRLLSFVSVLIEEPAPSAISNAHQLLPAGYSGTAAEGRLWAPIAYLRLVVIFRVCLLPRRPEPTQRQHSPHHCWPTSEVL